MRIICSPHALSLANDVDSCAASATISLIAEQRMMHVLRMHPDLVRAPCLQLPLHERCCASSQRFQHSPCADCMPSPAPKMSPCELGVLNGLKQATSGIAE